MLDVDFDPTLGGGSPRCYSIELERSTIARDILDHHPDADLFWAKTCTPPARAPTKPCRLFG